MLNQQDNCHFSLNNMNDSNFSLCDQERFSQYRNSPRIRETIPQQSQVQKGEILDPMTVMLRNTARPEYAGRISELKGAGNAQNTGNYTVPKIRVSNKPVLIVGHDRNVGKGREASYVYDKSNWRFKTTIKQETEVNKYQRINPNAPSYKKPTRQPYDRQKTTIKQQTLLEDYVGQMGSGEATTFMDRTEYYNAVFNGLKEATLPGRMPTKQGAKVANGMNAYNIQMTKIQYDTSQFSRGINRISTPTNGLQPQWTSQPQLYDDSQMNCDRINPNLLTAFNNNPYTQPLKSFIVPYNPTHASRPDQPRTGRKNDLSQLKPNYHGI